MRKERLLELLRFVETKSAIPRSCPVCLGRGGKHGKACDIRIAIADLEAELAGKLRVCRECGCHERDACMIGNIGCHWIGPNVDLCSVCADKTDTEPPSAANGFGFYKRAKLRAAKYVPILELGKKPRAKTKPAKRLRKAKGAR